MDPLTAGDANPGSTTDGSPSATPESAIPPQTARVVAFVSVLLGGLSGGLVGLGLGRFECEGSCGTWHGASLMGGALLGAGGIAIVVVLALRAMSEWHTIKHIGQPQ